jgi:FtsH-binding integral membrane protein
MNVSNLMSVPGASHWSKFKNILNSSVTPWAALILGASATALVGLGYYRWSHKDQQPDQIDAGFEKVKKRVSHAYTYVFGGYALTAAAAALAHISGLSQKILQNKYLSIPFVLGSCAALVATLLIDHKNEKTKHVAWGIFNVTMGIMMSPLGYLNQKIVAQAAAISLGLGSALTFCAYLAPDRNFLAWEGPLMTALTSISIASFVALFFPHSAFAYGVDRASLYGGLIIFSGLLMSSTQRLMSEAEHKSDKAFDPINSSMRIYLDGMNIFVRLLRMMLENKKEDKN